MKEVDVKFSIAIPAFKKRYLFDAIKSCLNQTYSNLEIVVVDDCSPEDLSSVVKSINDVRVKYFRNKTNIGAINVVDNWNRCLSLCSGEYVICMGDDDMLMPNCIDEYIKLINKYPSLDVFHARTATINENGEFIGIVQSRNEFENIYEFMRHRFDGWMQYVGDFCYRTSALKSVNGFYKQPLAWGSDDITAFIAIGKKGIANTNTVSFLYRTNSWSITSSSYTSAKLLSNVQTFKWVERFLSDCTLQTLEEELTYAVLVEKLPIVKQNMQASLLLQCFKRNKITIFKYYLQRKEFEITTKTILKSIIRSLK